MTSGTFKSLPIDSITVDREGRQRKSLDKIEDLADSIRRAGLIHPPVVRKDGTLVVGERRLTACKRLGWTSIPVQFIEDLSEHETRLVELEENVRRLDLSWQDQVRAVQEYHSIREKTEDNWSATKTAEAIGFSPRMVQECIQVYSYMEKGEEAVINAPKFSVAKGIVIRKTARARTDAIKELETTTPVVLGDDEPEPERLEPDPAPFINEDFHSWAKTYKGDPFNFIHCDFPYGINADQHAQGNAAARGGYEDSKDTYLKLLETLCNTQDRFLTSSAHMMFWFSMEYYVETYDILSSSGWWVLRRPLVWFRSDNSGVASDARRRPRNVYETCFMASRGDRFIVGPVGDCVAAPNIKSIHMSEKPRPVLKHFFRMFVDETSRVLDPTSGSGNALRVAHAMGAAHCLGIEQNEEFFNLAIEEWNNADN